jgi:hypothetical protein
MTTKMPLEPSKGIIFATLNKSDTVVLHPKEKSECRIILLQVTGCAWSRRTLMEPPASLAR